MTSWQERQAIDKFRRLQITNANQVNALIRREWAALDVGDIDAGRARVIERVSQRVSLLRGVGARQADAFVVGMRELARVGSGSVVLADASLGAAGVESLEIAGPISFKQRVGKGVIDEVAFLAARDQMMAEARKIIMQAGRDTVQLSSDANRRSIGWRRVSDGNPCTFCAMLVGRGPVYKSIASTQGTVERLGRSGDYELIYHKHCGCTAVEIFDDWEPTEREQTYVDAYMAAAEYADAQGVRRGPETILKHMREHGEFKDSPTTRNATK